jgi:hypothetical protein
LNLSSATIVHFIDPIFFYLLLFAGKYGVSSLAVVGQMGVLLGNISITDVSAIWKDFVVLCTHLVLMCMALLSSGQICHQEQKFAFVEYLLSVCRNCKE